MFTLAAKIAAIFTSDRQNGRCLLQADKIPDVNFQINVSCFCITLTRMQMSTSSRQDGRCLHPVDIMVDVYFRPIRWPKPWSSSRTSTEDGMRRSSMVWITPLVAPMSESGWKGKRKCLLFVFETRTTGNIEL